MIKQNVKKTFELIADKFDRVRKVPWHDLVKFINDTHFISDENLGFVLDLGCGNGRHGNYIWNNKPDDRTLFIVGIDISLNLLKIARKSNKYIHFINADANFLPLKSKCFNKILFIAAIHHIPSYKARKDSLLETKRILLNNGSLLISVWMLWQKRFYKYFLNDLEIKNYNKWDGEFGDIFVPWHDENKNVIAKRFYHLFSIDEFKMLVNDASFDICQFKIGGTKTEKSTIFAILKSV